MTAAQASLAGRRLAASLMIDRGAAKRPTGRTTQDETTGAEAPTYIDLFTSTHKIQSRKLNARSEQVGDRTAVTVAVELHLPIGKPDLQVGDIWTVTAVDRMSRSRVGRQVRILGPADKTFLTAMRYDVEEIAS